MNGRVVRAQRTLAALSVLAVALASGIPVLSQSGSSFQTTLVLGREAVAREVLVRFAGELSDVERSQLRQQLDVIADETIGSGINRVRSRTLDVPALVALLRSNPAVVYVEPNYIVRAVATPNDPLFPNLWGLLNTGQIINGHAGVAGADIRATAAWDVSTGSKANVVMVIDTGIDYTHQDLATNVWSAPSSFTVTIGGTTVTCPAGSHGFNAIVKTCDPRDDNNHGTHVSGTIGGVGNNGLGVTGVNWTTSIMGAKFLDASGSGSTGDAINSIEFAIQAKNAFAATAGANVRVLSNSWGGGGFSQALLDEINKANTNGMLFVAAAGNNSSDNNTVPFYPADLNAPNVVAVAATDNADQLASFSNYGSSTVHLGAPGVSVLSTTIGNTYQYFSGTSMATPHVSGAAALILSACALDTATLKSTILNNVDLIPSLTGKTITGGRLNVNRAIRSCASSAPPFTLTGSPTTVVPGGALTVQWTAPSGRPADDWVALFAVGAPNNVFVWWQFTGGATSGSITLNAPTTPGQYEFRYLLHNGYVDAARSPTITVSAASAFTVTASPTSVSAGGALTVQWTAPSGRPADDWVALFAVGAPDNVFGWWQFTGGVTSGSVTLNAPTTPGQYEFRYLLHNDYVDAARSAPVTVH